jgi:hypothetical protein
MFIGKKRVDDACYSVGVEPNDYTRGLCRLAPLLQEETVLRVFKAIDGLKPNDYVVAQAAKFGSGAERIEWLERAFISATSGRVDADELRAAFALGGWVAVRDLLEAQGAAHARTDSP